MKYLLLSSLLLVTTAAFSQNAASPSFSTANFAQEVLDYEPLKRAGVTQAQFDKGLFRLAETKEAVNHDPEQFTYADYWNIAMAFVSFEEPSAHIAIAFQKAISADAEKVCQVLSIFGPSQLDTRIPAIYYPFWDGCANLTGKEQDFDVATYAADHGLSLALVAAMYEIHQADIQYRYGSEKDMSKQAALDQLNQQKIESLYEEYGTYIGYSLVGERLQHTMWAVIQHSDIAMMEQYLPVVQQAVEEGELKVTPLKMLIDRYYGLQYGYQVYGTQGGFGFAMASDEKRAEISARYGIE